MARPFNSPAADRKPRTEGDRLHLMGRTFWVASCGHGVDLLSYVPTSLGDLCPDCAAEEIKRLREIVHSLNKRASPKG
jgi:hypothetical protein